MLSTAVDEVVVRNQRVALVYATSVARDYQRLFGELAEIGGGRWCVRLKRRNIAGRLDVVYAGLWFLQLNHGYEVCETGQPTRHSGCIVWY